MHIQTKEIDFLFEISWEVCNKVGGIYTVLSTKAKTLTQHLGNNLIFIGPDVWSDQNPCPVFKPSATLLSGWRKNVSLPYGLSVRVGRWDIPGKPIAILVDFKPMFAHKNEIYGQMWQNFGVDSLHAYGDYDEACAFANAAATVAESIARYKGLDATLKSGQPKYNVVMNFDEWTTGMGLLAIQKALPQAATVFTTHATSIGRSICSNGKPLYDYLHAYDGDQMAAELNMQSKHSLEKQAAHACDAFTTVSAITAEECRQLIGRKPDAITVNGFEPGFVPHEETLAKKRKTARSRLIETASALTGKHYPDNTFITATSGRCEFRNKGIDVFLDSLKTLASMNPASNILAFVLVPSWQSGPRTDLVDALGLHNRKRLSNPFVTHRLHNFDNDAIVNKIKSLGFNNDFSSKVDVVFVPCYLDGNDGIINMHYYDVLPGIDATVFASYYEPWGYTPLESIAFGVPTLTTSLSGYGRWILENFENGFEYCGTRVINRTDSNYADVCRRIAEELLVLTMASPSQKALYSQQAKSTAEKALWNNFIKYYWQAYTNALENRDRRLSVNSLFCNDNQRTYTNQNSHNI